jgi:uncharacterized iron-regulated membrane protein
MDALDKAHFLGLGIMTGLSLLCLAGYYLFVKPRDRRKTNSQLNRQTPTRNGTAKSRSQSADWIDVTVEQPIWYKNLIIKTPSGEVLKGWARVSDGDHDYYVSNTEINRVIPVITHWKYINQN